MIFAAVHMDPTDPGRKQFGQRDTFFILPAWHELNRVAGLVRGGMRVADAYINAGLPDIAPPEGMLACMARVMSIMDSLTRGYLTNYALSRECVDCWEMWMSGPPREWYVFADRITLAIGLVIPSENYQNRIIAHIAQGVPLRRAYEYAGQGDILPEAWMLDCMEGRIRAGAAMSDAATRCSHEGPVTVTPIGPTPTVTPPWVPGAPSEGLTARAWLLPAALAAAVALLISVRRRES